jgi:hypothetical protein
VVAEVDKNGDDDNGADIIQKLIKYSKQNKQD